MEEIYRLIPRTRLKELQQLNGWARWGGLALNWVGIIGAIVLCERYFSIPLYLATVLWLSARMLALGVIMHDGVHGVMSRNRWVNDWTSDLFAAWPIFVSMRSYRVKHLEHHAHLNSGQDPDFVDKAGKEDWEFPMRPARLGSMIFKLLTGLSVFGTYKVMSARKAPEALKRKPLPAWYQAARVAYYAVIVGALLYAGMGWLFVKYWIVPIATGLQALNRMRRIAEHSAIPGKPANLQTRTTIHGFWSRLLLVPANINLHNEHHLYPGVPLYNLPALHRELMSHPLAQERLHVSRSYLGVYRELTVQNSA